MFETVFEIPHSGKHEQRENSGENRYRVHSEAYCNTDAGGNPQARCGRRTVYDISAEDNNAASEKSDAHNYSRRDTHRIKASDAEIRRIHEISRDDKQACPQSHQAEGARTGGLLAITAR